MTPHLWTECIKILVAVVALLSATPGLAASIRRTPDDPSQPNPSVAPSADVWDDVLTMVLDQLRTFLLSGSQPIGDLTASIQTVRDLYYDSGIPQGADKAYGRSLVAAAYAQVQGDPGVLDPDLRKTFLNDLLQMYTELQGNPSDLMTTH